MNLPQPLLYKFVKYIISIVIALFSLRYRGKRFIFPTHSDFHRTTVTHFLDEAVAIRIVVIRG